MKSFLSAGVVLVVSMFSVSAVAVTTSLCPQRLVIEAKNLEITHTIKHILDTLRFQNEVGFQFDAVKESLRNVYATKSIQRFWSIQQRGNGRCLYREGNSTEKAELYTKEGRSILLFQVHIGPRGILLRTYASVSAIAPGGITFTVGSTPGLALAMPRYPYENYEAGGPLAFIGKVNNFQVSVR